MESLVVLTAAFVTACHSPKPVFQPTSFAVHTAGTGRPVILIPGLGCPGSVWDDTVAHLHAQTHVLTLAGFAGQPPIAGELLPAVREELAAYIRDRKLDHPVIIGHSLGGHLAMWFAETHPELAGPVIVVDEGPSILARHTTPAGADRLRDQLMRGSHATWETDTRAMFSDMAKDTKKMAPVIDAVVRSDRRTFAESFRLLFVTDLGPDLAKISAPLLLVTADSPFSAEMESEIAAVPTHEIHRLRGTRHFVMFDDPPAFFAVIDQFLAAHP